MKKFGFVFAMSLFAAMIFTCRQGLGEVVDVEKPTGKILYPPEAAVIRGTFYLAGECNDDSKIDRVEITLKNNVTEEKQGPFLAELSEDRKSWSFEFNKKVRNLADLQEGEKCYGFFDRDDGTYGYSLPDGKYTFSAIAYDAHGKNSGESSHSYVIDNTAPFMIIKSPGIAADESVPAGGTSTPSPYGAKFKVVGTIVEDNNVSKLYVDVAEAAPKSAIEGNSLTPRGERLEFENINIAGGTEELIADSSANQEDTFYKDYVSIYGDLKLAEGEKYDTKNFYAKITLIDGAKEYHDKKGQSPTSEEGNKTTRVYINDKVSEKLTVTKNGGYGLEARAIQQILNETYEKIVEGNIRAAANVEISRSDVLEELNKCVSASGYTAFSLNPDASPKYTVSGYTAKEKDGKLDTDFTATISQTITINAKAGRDNYYIEPKTFVYRLFGPYDTCELSKIKEIYKDPAAYAETKEGKDYLKYTKYNSPDYNSSSVESYPWEVSLPDKIVANKYYVVTLTGKDKQDMDLVPDDGCYYIFKGSSNKMPPTLTCNNQNNTYYNTTKIDFTGTASCTKGTDNEIKAIKWNAVVVDQKTGTQFGSNDSENPNSVGVTKDEKTGGYNWTFNLEDLSDFSNENLLAKIEDNKYYQIDVDIWAIDNEDLSSSHQQRTVFVDTYRPEFSLSGQEIAAVSEENDKENFVGANNVNYKDGKFTLSGVFQDEGAGLQSYYYKICDDFNAIELPGLKENPKYDSANNASPKFILADENDKSWQVANFSTSRISIGFDVGNFSKKQIAIFAVDKQKNRSKLYAYKINFDADAPKIEITSPKPNASGENVILNTDLIVSGKIDEKDLQEVTLYDGSTALATWKKGESNNALTLTEDLQNFGSYTFSYTITSSEEKTFRLKVSASDVANGMVESQQVVCVYDKTPPSFEISDSAWSSIPTLPDEVYFVGIENPNVSKDSSNRTYTIKGNASDNGSGVSAIFYKTVTNHNDSIAIPEIEKDGTTWKVSENGGNDAWTRVVGTTQLAAVINVAENIEQQIAIFVVDKAGNKSILQSYKVKFDLILPVANITSPTALYIKNASDVKISGTITEKDLKSVVISDGATTLATWENSTSNPAGLTLTAPTAPNSDEWNFEYTISNPQEKTYEITVVATDGAGQSASSSKKTFAYDKTAPSFSLTNLSPDENSNPSKITIYGDEGSKKQYVSEEGGKYIYSLQGKWSDQNGSGTSKMQYSWTGSDYQDVPNSEGLNVTSEKTFTFSIPIEEGINKTLYLKAIDLAENEKSETFSGITFDFKKPVIEITAPSKKYVKNGEALSFTAKISDNTPIDENSISVKLKKTSPQGSDIELSRAQNSGTNDYTISGSDNEKTISVNYDPISDQSKDGKYTIEILATDQNDHAATPATYEEIIIDTKAPEFSALKIAGKNVDGGDFSSTYFNSQSLKLEGNITEETSGIYRIHYAVTENNSAPQVGDATAQMISGSSFDINASGFKDGENFLWIALEDNAGNIQSFGTATKVNVDTNPPEAEIEKITATQEGDQITSSKDKIFVHAKITEANLLSSVKILVFGSGGQEDTSKTWSATADDLSSINGNNAEKTFSHEFNVSTWDGSFQFQIEAEDKAGNKRLSQKSSKILVDRTAPQISVTIPAQNKSYYADDPESQNYFSQDESGNKTFSIRGSWSDQNGSGTSKMQYSWTGSDYQDVPNSSGLGVTNESNFTFAIPVTEGNGQTLYLKAFDLAENESSPTSISGLTFDFEKPKIQNISYAAQTGTLSAYTADGKNGYYLNSENQNLTISATITDSYKIIDDQNKITVTAKKDGSDVNATEFSKTINANPAASEKSFDLNITLNPSATPSKEGEWIFKIEVTDACDQKVSEETLPIFVDVTKPTLSSFALSDGTSQTISDANATYNFGASNLNAEGTVSDGGSKLSRLVYHIGSSEKPAISLEEKTSLSESVFSGFSDGNNNFYLEIFDKAGNKSRYPESGNYTINVDTAAPQVQLEGPFKEENDAPGTQLAEYSSSAVWFKAIVTEGNLQKVKFEVSPDEPSPQKSIEITSFAESTTGNTRISISSESGTPVYTIMQKFDVSSWADARYSVSLIAEDKVSREQPSKSAQKTFLVDRTAPQISVTNLQNNAQVFADEGDYKKYISIDDATKKVTFSLKGSLKDVDNAGAGGSGTNAFYYAWDENPDSQTPQGSWATFEDAPDNVTSEKSFSVDLDITEKQGSHTLYLKATDAAGNSSSVTELSSLTFDFEKPSIYIEDFEGNTGLGFDFSQNGAKSGEGDIAIYVKQGGTLEFNAKVIDSFGGLSENNVTVKAKKDDTEITDSSVTVTKTQDSSNPTKEISIKIQISQENATNDGEWTFEISANDENNRVAIPKTSPKAIIDATAPSMSDTTWGGVSHTNLQDQYFNSTALQVAGWASDTLSGVSIIHYKVYASGETEPTDFTGQFSAGARETQAGDHQNHNTISATISGLKAGLNNVKFTPEDKAGNKGSEATYQITVDQSSPIFESFSDSGTKLVNGKADIITSGKVSDDNAIKKVYYTLNQKTYNATYFSDEGLQTQIEANSPSGEITGKQSPVYYKITIPAQDIADASGNNSNGQVSATVEDKAGNTTSQIAFTLNIDTTRPVFDISSATSGLNGKSAIRGTANDDKDMASIELYFMKKADYDQKYQSADSKTFSKNTPYGMGSSEWCPTEDGWKRISKTGAVSSDKNPANLDVYRFTNSAEIFNWKFGDAANSGGFDWNANSDAASKTEGSGDASVHTGIDEIYILPVVIDKAGNASCFEVKYENSTTTYEWNVAVAQEPISGTLSGYYGAYKFGVDLNSDKPLVKLENLSSDLVLTFGTNAQIRGRVTDDDSSSTSVVKDFVISSTQITSLDSSGITKSENADEITYTKSVSVNGESKNETTTFNKKTGVWTFTPADVNDGPKVVYFYIKDNDETIFYSSNANNLYLPKVQCNDEEENGTQVSKRAKSGITYNSDSNAPTVSYIKYVAGETQNFTYDASDWETFSAATAIGGSLKRYVRFQVTSHDDNGIASMAFKFNGEQKTITGTAQEKGLTSYENSIWVTDAIDLNGLSSEITEVSAEPVDHSGMRGGSKMSFYVDNEVPSDGFRVSSPNESDIQTGNITIQGIANDGSGAGLKEDGVKWMIPNLNETTSAITQNDSRWKGEIASGRTASAWAFNFNGTDNNKLSDYIKTENSASQTYQVVDKGSGVFEITLLFKIEDKLGNFIINERKIQYDPDATLPKAEITYPLSSNDAESPTKVGKNIRITGSAIGYNPVSKTYLQLAITENTTEPTSWSSEDSTLSSLLTSDELSGSKKTISNLTILNNPNDTTSGHLYKVSSDWWGIETNGTTSWNLTINKNGTLSDKKYLWIRACVIDEETCVGRWTQPQMVQIDTDSPEVGSVALKFVTCAENQVPSESNTTDYATYEEGIYLSKNAGKLYLAVSLIDASGILNWKVNEAIAGNFGKDISTSVTAQDKNAGEYSVSSTGSNNCQNKLLYIPVNTTLDGSISYTIYATEDTNDQKEGLLTCSFFIDNTAPKMGRLESSDVVVSKNKSVEQNKLRNSNYRVNVYSDVTDSGSGFKFVAMTFKRSDGSSEKIMNPFPQKNGSDWQKQNVTGAQIGSGGYESCVVIPSEQGSESFALYGKSVNVSIDSANSKLTGSFDTNFVRKGGIVKVNNRWYIITEASSSEVKVSGTFPKNASGVSAFFSDAIIIESGERNATKNEGITGSFNGSYQITEQDGDGILESVVKSGNVWNWEANFHSDAISDGKVDIILVAFDVAGNCSAQKVSTMISNNAPRLSKVWLATDLNYNSKYEQSEFAYTTSVNGELLTKYAYSALNPATGEGQEVVNLIKTSGGTPETPEIKFRVKNNLALTFEYVGSISRSDITYDANVTNSALLTPRKENNLGTNAISQNLSSIQSTATQGDLAYISKTGVELTNTSFFNSYSSFENSKDQMKVVNEEENPPSATPNLAWLNFTLWDKASGEAGAKGDETSANGLFSTYGNQFTLINIPFYLDIADDEEPISKIEPLSAQSAYKEEVATGDVTEIKIFGHVDPSSSLDQTKFNASSGEKDNDDKVSGKIVFTGSAKDNAYIKSLTISAKNTSQNLISSSGSAVTVANFESSSGILKFGSEGNAYSESGVFEIKKLSEKFSQEGGHEITWELTVDTSKVQNVAANDIEFIVTAGDNSSHTTSAQKRVDIVPYITSVERPSSAKNTSEYQRSRFGRYAVSEGETLTIRGFNFASGMSSKVGNTNVTLSNVTLDGTASNSISKVWISDTESAPYSTKSYFEMTVPGNSGELVVSVNNVESLNHKNGDVINGTPEILINREQNDYYSEKTMRDNRYLSVWNLGNFFKDTDGGAELQEPVMTSDKEGNLYASWVAQSNANVKFSYGVGKDSRPIFRFYDQPATTTAIAMDKSGKNAGAVVAFIPEHQGVGGTFSVTGMSSAAIVGGMGLIQVPKGAISAATPATSANDVTVGGNPIMFSDNNVEDPTTSTQNKSSYWNIANYDMNRRLGSFESPRTIRFRVGDLSEGNSESGEDYLHTIWYDNVTHALKYSVVNVNDKNDYQGNSGAIANGGWVVIDGGFTGQDRVHSWSKTGTNENNTIKNAQGNQHTSTGTGKFQAVYSTDIFISSARVGNNKEGDNYKTNNYFAEKYENDNQNYTSIKVKDVASSIAIDNNLVGMTIMLMDNTQGNYKQSLRTITSVSDNTISWADSVNHKIHAATIYCGNMNVVGGTATANINDFNPTGQSNDAGSSSAIDVTSDGKPIIAYVDTDTSTLRVAKANAVKPILASNWERTVISGSGGCTGEVSMKVDKNNKIHIIYQDSRSRLCYITDKSGSWSSPVVIDTEGSLSYGSLSLIEDDTKVTPTATYLNTAGNANAVKYAFETDGGAWDVQIVPAKDSGHYALKDNRVSLESRKSTWTGTDNGTLQNGGSVQTATPATVDSAIAFKTSTAFETVYLKKE